MTKLPDPDARGRDARVDTSLVTDLTALYRARVPDLRLDLNARAAPAGRRLVARRWRPMLTVAGAAAVVAAFVVAPSLWGGDTRGVSAEEILQRTNAAAEGGAPLAGALPYHLVATTEFTGMICTAEAGTGATSSGATTPDAAHPNADSPDVRAAKCEANSKQSNTTEIWFADRDHFRNAQTFAGAKGEPASTFGQAANGPEAWIYMSDDTGIRVAHGSSEALGMMWGPGTPDSKSLADVLSQYSNDSCQSARQVGDATVLGRAAYVIEVRQTPELCDFGDGDIKRQIDTGDGSPGEKRLSKGSDQSTMKVWVDQETFLPLKTENRDANGTLAYGYYVTELEVGADIPASAFEYHPPAGATVTEVTSAVEAKQALSGEPRTDSDGGSDDSPEPERHPSKEQSAPKAQ